MLSNTNDENPINISNSTIPNGPINTIIDLNPDTSIVTIQWDKPKENSSYITGYQLKNHNNILQSFSPTSNIATINLTNNTLYSLTLETLYEGGSIISAFWKFTPNFTTKNNSNIPTSLQTTSQTSFPPSFSTSSQTSSQTTLPTSSQTTLPKIAVECVPGECGFVTEVKTRNYSSIYSIFHSILAFFAIYLSFKCNKGFSFGSFFMAIFFPYIYIIYTYATSEKLCGILNK